LTITTTKLSVAESVFEPVARDWLDQFRKVLWNHGKMDEGYYEKLAGANFCLVGDVRAKLGLSRGYAWNSDNDEFRCYYCNTIAQGFYELGSEAEVDPTTTNFRDYRIRYLDMLRRFHKHLMKQHGVKLENVK